MQHKSTDSQILSLLDKPSTFDEGFRVLVESYQKALYWHIRGIVGNHDDTDDVLQNTFLKTYKGLANFEGNSKLYTWIYRIATNESLTFVKRKKEMLSLDDSPVAYAQKETGSFDEETALSILHKGIRTLPKKQKVVFNLRYFEEMPYQEIAQVTGTSVGALKASYHHAVKKLEAFIKTTNIH